MNESSSKVAGVEGIRERFPALRRRYEGAEVAYFDGPGGTQTPIEVVEAVRDYLLHHNANSHWAFPTSQETDAIIDGARAAVADYVGGAPDEIVFGANMTTLTFHLARALGRKLSPGDEIVVTELDHHANVDPWRFLERERGVVVRKARVVAETHRGLLDMDDLERAITKKTKILAIGAASNAFGTINDVRRASAIAKAQGALVFVDAVHAAAHEPPDVKALDLGLDCDFLACSIYKIYGPHLGALWGRRALLEDLEAPKLDPAPEAAPSRMETGTQNHEGIAGARAAIDFLASLAPEGGSRRQRLEITASALHERGSRLLELLWEGLSATPGVSVFGPPPGSPRTPTIAFAVKGHSSTEIARHLAKRAIFVSNGDFYATTLVARLGYADQGIVRAGCAAYTTEEEVARLIEGVRAIR